MKNITPMHEHFLYDWKVLEIHLPPEIPASDAPLLSDPRVE